MAQAVVKYKTSELINTFSCQDSSNLILCVDPEKVLQPDGFVGTKGYIIAELLSGPTYCVTPSLPDCCSSPCPRYYNYEFVFDNAQLNIGEILDQCDIFSVIWDQCLIEWVTEVAAQGTPNAAIDTESINITLSDVLNRTIQADLNVSAEADNVFEVLPDGAYVKEIQTGVGLENTVVGTTQTLTISLPQPPTGRLTLTSLTPVTQSSVVGAVDLYYTYFTGGMVWLYTAAVWKSYFFDQVGPKSLASLVAANTNYDVFMVDTGSGTLDLAFSDPWTNDTTRANPLTVVNGVLVRQGIEGQRYLGTIRTTTAGHTDDSVQNRFVWNYYNQVPRALIKKEATNTWTYNSATFRPANGSTDNRISVVTGALSSVIDLTINQETGVPNAAESIINIGIDSTTVETNLSTAVPLGNGNLQTAILPGVVRLCAGIPVGYHYYQWLERAPAGTITYYGADYAGLVGFVNA